MYYCAMEQLKMTNMHLRPLMLTLGLIINLNSYFVYSTENYFTTNAQGFSSVPTTVKTYENETVLLPCYSTTPHTFVKWYRDDNLIADSQRPDLVPPPRVNLFNNGSLLVRQVQIEDTNEYLCEVMTDENGLESQLHAIEVQYAPSIISLPSGRTAVEVGTIFEIVCEARGIPQPIITWQYSGKPSSDYLDNTRRFLVEVKDRHMAGAIHCIATNGVGEPARAGIDLVVLFPPEISSAVSSVHTKLGFNAQIECHVNSEPPATVHWFHHGIPLQQSGRISRLDASIIPPPKTGGNSDNNDSVQQTFTTKHILSIRAIKENDLGVYECRAENKLGFQGTTVELTGRPMPSIFKKSPIMSNSMAFNLIWQTESLSPIIEYKLKFRQIPSGNITPQNRHFPMHWNELIVPSDVSEGPIHTIGYTLRGLQPATVYEASVISRNRFGWSDNSQVIPFATNGVDEQPIQSTEAADYENEDNHYYVPGSSSGSYEDDIDTYNEIDDTSSANGFEYNLKLLYRSIICVSLFTILLQ